MKRDKIELKPEIKSFELKVEEKHKSARNPFVAAAQEKFPNVSVRDAGEGLLINDEFFGTAHPEKDYWTVEYVSNLSELRSHGWFELKTYHFIRID